MKLEVVGSRGFGPMKAGALVVHTTGSTIVANAKARRADPVEYVRDYYLRPDSPFPHWLVAPDGRVLQFALPTERAAHAAWKPWEQSAYRDGTWRKRWASDYQDAVKVVSITRYTSWVKRWAGVADSPRELLSLVGGESASSPNGCTAGVELLWVPDWPTDAQIDAVAELHYALGFTADRARLGAGLPCPTLLGHDDLSPCRRTNRIGVGWDPGPDFPWARLASKLTG